MSTIKVFSCDGPGCEVHSAPHEYSESLPPNDWYILRHLSTDVTHFHSVACLIRYAEYQRDAAGVAPRLEHPS